MRRIPFSEAVKQAVEALELQVDYDKQELVRLWNELNAEERAVGVVEEGGKLYLEVEDTAQDG
jgi:hypothetical protein